MRKTINQTHVEGYLYEQALDVRVSGENSKAPGTPFIMGTIDIATDEAITNIVQIHFTYVTPTTAKGNTNATYTVLKDIIDGKYQTVMGAGKDRAVKLRIDSAIGLNDFYSNRNGAEELVSVKRNEGGFVHVTESLNANENERNTFTADMVITSAVRTEEDVERNLPEKVTVKGCIFDFRGSILPIDFTATNPGAMDYYEGLEASSNNPVFTKVWGKQISQTITRTYSEESAWGEDNVRTVTSNRRDWVITGGAKETYTFGTEDDDLSAAELKKAIGDREVYLASIKKRYDEYQSSKTTSTTVMSDAEKSGGFKF